MSTEPTGAPAQYGMFPQPKLRISAVYASGDESADGVALPPGMPESIEIELNEVPAGNLDEFVQRLVLSLFRNAPDGTSVSVSFPPTSVEQAKRLADQIQDRSATVTGGPQ